MDVTAPQGPMTPDVQETEIGASQAKPSILYFYWPNPEDPAGDACKALDAELWVDGQICKLAEKFVCIKVNGKTCPPQVLRQFDVTSFPTIVFEVCNKKIVSRVRSKCVQPKAFAKAMQSVLKTNDKVAQMLAAQNAKLDALVEGAGKMLESGKLDSAEKVFRKLLKDAPDSSQAGVAHAGLAEIGCRRNLNKGQDFLKKSQFAEARSFLQMAGECEVPCTARDEARDLLPECQFGLLYTEACGKLKAGDNLGAMEAFTKIASDTCYEGQYKGMAAQKLQEMKDAWNNKAN